MPKSRSGDPEGDNEGFVDRRHGEVPSPLQIDQSDIDPLLGTLVWSRFVALFEDEKAQGRKGAMLIVDLDQSRMSALAMAEGNRVEVLPLMADALRRAVRRDDLLAHVRDGRFALLLRGAEQSMASTIADRILESVEDTVFMLAEGIASLSVDVGGTAFSQDAPSLSDIIARADANLDQARAEQLHVRIA